MANHNDLSLLESLPQDLLGEILSRVAFSSREDIRQCVTVSKTISAATQDFSCIQQTQLTTTSHESSVNVRTLPPAYEQMSPNDNPAAHYIEGLKQYFIHENTILGLFHLKKSAEISYDNGTYIYGILMLCTGNTEEGKLFLGLLDWETSKRRADRCWRENKKSLRNFIITLKNEYNTNLINNLPPTSCHINDLDTRCPKCYHYKQMRKFVNFI
ncbi:LOW QUALITY PROTEIN: hypothetical protein N665_0022s0011 [Sinapis alba]|nr:LOW QUALITY PROTEIN: hypothetical protein N665_0022s0011 [Sinapis alba]